MITDNMCIEKNAYIITYMESKSSCSGKGNMLFRAKLASNFQMCNNRSGPRICK